MSRRINLPAEVHVRQIVAEVIAEAGDNGRRPTVIALARKLGLDNATFRRHFPEIVQELREKALFDKPVSDGPTRFQQLQKQHAQLKRDHDRLTAELDAAQAVIQRLALENEVLRAQASGASVVPLRDRMRRREHTTGQDPDS